jgi:uncharacterized repeat protein (TIGR01451 family)
VTAGTITADGSSCDVSGTYTYAEDGSYTVSVSVSNGSSTVPLPTGTANVGEDSLSMSSDAVTVQEGTQFSGAVATLVDPGSTDPPSAYTATIDWGDGTTTAGTITAGSPGEYVISGTHTYGDELSGSVSVTAYETSDPSFSLEVGGGLTVTEGDVLTPTPITISPTEGASFSGVVGTFADSLTTTPASDFTATIDWGDGTTTAGTITSVGAGSFQVSGDHTYAEEGKYTVTAKLSDDAPGTATATALSTANVADAPLTASGTSLIETPGSPFTATVAHFTDADPAGTVSDYTATIDWGDGTALSAGTIVANLGGGFDVTGSHTYTGSGSKTVTVKITDAGGATITATGSITLPLADLAVSVGATPNPVKFGATLTYKVTLKNGGPTSAANAVLNDALPAQVQFQTISSGGMACLTPAVGATGTISCKTATLANGASATITVTVKVVGGGKSSITDTVTASSDALDPNTANNTASVTTNIFGRH